MGETWRGLYPITAFVRDALRKANGNGAVNALSPPEETLLTACEFWLAVSSGQLSEHLKTNPVRQLLNAQEAFARIGAARIASTLRATVAGLKRANSAVPVEKTAAHIEEALSRTEDEIDELIAQFAAKHMGVSFPHPASGR
ncbi:MAG TPA: hypothetical protein VGN30_06945 [Steroidobacteraceae bacterium]|jgi:hypothetical protein